MIFPVFLDGLGGGNYEGFKNFLLMKLTILNVKNIPNFLPVCEMAF